MATESRGTGQLGEEAGEAGRSGSTRWRDHPAFHVGLLALVTAWCLAISWRKWADLGADFGRELYLPWRISEGALLYRDVDDFYGPLSQYLNAGLFRVFGPGMMVLVVANLAVFAGILMVLHSILRRAWTATTATIASVVFIVVFGFSRAIGTGNFNYATPYSHESTHGLLILLLLVVVCLRLLRKPSLGGCMGAGGLVGLTLVLKPEFVLAAGGVSVATAAIWKVRRLPVNARWFAGWVAGVALPTLAFALFFSRQLGWAEAWSSACRAWINVVATTRFVGEPAQLYYLGLDAPRAHAISQGLATMAALAILGGIAVAGWGNDQLKDPGLRRLGTGALALGIGVGSFVFRLHWIEVGKCLLGLTLIWFAAQVFAWIRVRRDGGGEVGALEARLLLGVAAVAMMARMFLNGRVYQFGFFQAALAGVVVTAALVGEFPGVKLFGAAGRFTVRVAMGVLLASAVGLFALQNHVLYRQIDFPIGEGRDRFFVYGPSVFPQGRVAANLIAGLKQVGTSERLLVLPEGLMLNYLARMPSPLPHFFYYSAVTAGGREQQIVQTLAARPPGWVVISNRDLREYGIASWGERSGAGKDLLDWVKANYQPAGQVDGQPMDLQRDGFFVFRRKD